MSTTVRFILALLLLVTAGAAAAQQDCGQGLPCGPVPWRLPRLPRLPSPTPMPTIAVVNQDGFTGTITPTVTPTPQATSQIDQAAISDQLATVSSVMAATPLPVYNAMGTPVDTQADFAVLSTNARQFFGYALGISTEPFGALSPLVTFTVAALGTVIAVKVLTFLMPILGVLFGLIRKLVQVVLDFIPL